ncbi:MAG: DsrE family protein [Candidatus Hodarchaeales archaeon]
MPSMLIVASNGPEVAERCYMPFIVGATAQAMDVEVAIFFIMDGVVLMQKGMAKRVKAPGYPPLDKTIEEFMEAGGKVYICSNSQNFRKISPDKGFVKGVEIAGAAKLVECIHEYDKTVYI